MLRAITPQTRLIFLASPNNPTGTRVGNEELDAFLRQLPSHVIAVLDEAYYEFLDHPPDTIAHVRQGANVVLMRTFSKIQGLAGLRIGYGLASGGNRRSPPARAPAVQREFHRAGRRDRGPRGYRAPAAHQDGHRRRPGSVVEAAFSRMGLRYVPSSANFVLVHVGDGGEVFKRLMKKGIIVRSMVSYHLPEYIRVSIGAPEQNARFLAELPDALTGLVEFKSMPPTAAPAPAPEIPTYSTEDFSSADAGAPPKTTPHPIAPPDPEPDVAPERVPVPDPTPNPERDPEETDPEPESEPDTMPEPFSAADKVT